MPEYDVRTVIPLSESQQDALAEAITRIHSTKFTTPRLFVNVKFTDVSKQRTYVGGKRHQGNHIFANVRVGPSRTPADWDDLSKQVVGAWEDVVQSEGSGRECELQSFIIMGGMQGGYEAGFPIPPAGGDVQWMRDNMEGFKKKAADGHEGFIDMLAEIEERGLMKDANGKA
ncbi:unnamed protein product [Zymoseptoria tritici ST99CH_3D1]|uniref:Tautomerase cis-CaaD-like domain-containing protein n=1 Tax=Zymoseptoria tritici ST99CH_1E4 TaxID=1276532 RepID=A0A2H1GYW1_ZYMTR|nr:unnamed protein product [Zymoseptoria tritici ST99CH_1E4]SMR61731.1 unnamed protein product [Zymoseptoria tritici ST99CH_3D1]